MPSPAWPGRRAVLLQNHGAVTYGNDLGQAYERAELLEWLAVMDTAAAGMGTPRILSAAELDQVVGRRRGLNKRRAG